MTIALVGPPGSGKGAQSVRIRERYPKLCYVNPMDLLRDEIVRQSTMGEAAVAGLSLAKPVGDADLVKLVKKKVDSVSCAAGYILDGFPKNVAQAQQFAEAGEDVDGVLRLEVPDATVTDRLGGRWIHRASGRIYHARFAPPQKAGHDDVTGEALEQRADDKPDVVQARIAAYRKAETSLLECYSVKEDDAQRYTMQDGERKAVPLDPSEGGPGAKCFTKRAPTVARVDASGSLDRVRRNLFDALDELALQRPHMVSLQLAKPDVKKAAGKPWWKLW